MNLVPPMRMSCVDSMSVASGSSTSAIQLVSSIVYANATVNGNSATRSAIARVSQNEIVGLVR
jgi:hypothetical protein